MLEKHDELIPDKDNEKSTILILVCFALVSMNNGYRVQRNDENEVHTLNVDTFTDGDGDEFNDQNNLTHFDENNEEIHEADHENFPGDINENLLEENNETPEDHNNFHQEQIEELGDGDDDDEELHITDSVPEDVGVDGSLEVNFPSELCDVEGSKVFLPITKNCSQFFDCTNKEGSYCPQGMWFDPNYEGDTFCQFPEVICAADNNICDCAEKYPPPPPDPLIEQSVSCLNDNRFHLYPSQVNCGRYFICHNDMKYRMECRQGLHYNSKTEMCDYPEVVNCRIPDPDCPAEGIQFLPDATRCEVFYFCVHGFKTKQICPFYHIWDVRSNSCRRQDEAICHLDA